MSRFIDMLEKRWAAGKFVCVGLDPLVDKIPASVLPGAQSSDRIVSFCMAIVYATAEHALAYKPNAAFFEALGDVGIASLRTICQIIRREFPHIPIILDYKRGDIGKSNAGYVQFATDYVDVDAVTINPYLGQTANEPWLTRKDLGVIVLCKTSNPGAGELQDRLVLLTASELLELEGTGSLGIIDDRLGPAVPLIKYYQLIAHRVARHWNQNGNCALVTGATYPNDIAIVRQLVGPSFPLLIPGVGTQGGDLEAAVRACAGSEGGRFLLNASSSISYASPGADFAEAARAETIRLTTQINDVRQLLAGA